MKKRILGLVLSIIMLISTVAIFSSCKGTEQSTETTDTEKPLPKVSYTVTMQRFNIEILELTVAYMEETMLEHGWIKAADADTAEPSTVTEKKEILVGTTEREESNAAIEELKTQSDLPEESFMIKLSADKVVIVGSNVKYTALGVKYFTEEIVAKKEANSIMSEDKTVIENPGKILQIVNGVGAVVLEYTTDIYVPKASSSTEQCTYAKIIRLEHNGDNNGTLLATRETEKSGKSVNPIYKSTDDGLTWTKVVEVKDNKNSGANLMYQPYLFELPADVGEYKEGTILMAGCTVLTSNRTIMALHVSTDCGATWTTVDNIAIGGIGGPAGPNSNGYWEPVLMYEEETGRIFCFYSDETDRAHSQKLVYRHTTDLKNWSDAYEAVASENADWRPGMAAITKMGNGKYALVFEYAGRKKYDYEYPYVHIKIGNALDDWGDPADDGKLLKSDKNLWLGAGPSIGWTPNGGPNGALFVTGQNNYPYTADRKNDLFMSFDYGETWVSINNPIEMHHNSDVRCGYSSGMFISSDGNLYYVNDPERERGGKCEKLTFAKIKIY